MKPIRSSLVLFCAAAALLPYAGCGGSSDSDADQVLETALSRESLLAPPVGEAEVEVASLGFEGAVLESRRLAVDRDTNEEIREALAGSADPAADGGDPGLAALIDDLSLEESQDLDGVQVDRVSGTLDVDGLIDRIRPIARQPGAGESEAIPGVGELNRLEDTLAGAGFELFAAESDGSLERFDLILSLDDPGNALPPSRVRFSLTGAVEPGS